MSDKLLSQESKELKEPREPQVDLIIVGGGISGLSIGISALKKFPTLRVVILEKYGYIGGRVTTYQKKIPEHSQTVHWENGAGRISTAHTKVLKLIRKYGLHTIPLSPNSEFRLANGDISTPIFEDVLPAFIQGLQTLPVKTLGTHTLAEMVSKRDRQRLFQRFPYWAEPYLLRGDLALKTFQEEMGSQAKYVVCQEGLGTLAKAMANDFEKRGGLIYLRTEIINIRHETFPACDIVTCIRTDPKPGKTTVQLEIAGKATVLALHAVALDKIFKTSLAKTKQPSFLKYLKMVPLLRMYAVFPVKNNKSWFSDISRTVTSSPIRFFIPIQPSSGIVMISYTEGPDATYWIEKMEKHGEAKVCHEVMDEIRKLFPEKNNIPEPIFFKMHPWSEGCTYWLPGKYDPLDESRKSIHPVPDILPTTFVCGESTSLRQAWIEGALEQAELLQTHSKLWGIFE